MHNKADSCGVDPLLTWGGFVSCFFPSSCLFFFKHLCLFQDNLWFPLDREGGGWMGWSDSAWNSVQNLLVDGGTASHGAPECSRQESLLAGGGAGLGLAELGPSGGAEGEQSCPWAVQQQERDSSISHQHTELNFLSWGCCWGEEDNFEI